MAFGFLNKDNLLLSDKLISWGIKVSIHTIMRLRSNICLAWSSTIAHFVPEKLFYLLSKYWILKSYGSINHLIFNKIIQISYIIYSCVSLNKCATDIKTAHTWYYFDWICWTGYKNSHSLVKASMNYVLNICLVKTCSFPLLSIYISEIISI